MNELSSVLCLLLIPLLSQRISGIFHCCASAQFSQKTWACGRQDGCIKFLPKNTKPPPPVRSAVKETQLLPLLKLRPEPVH